MSAAENPPTDEEDQRTLSGPTPPNRSSDEQEFKHSPTNQPSSQRASVDVEKDAAPKHGHSAAGIFSKPGTIPLPDAGYHCLGVVWEDLTVYGVDQGRKMVQSCERSLIKVSPYRLRI